MLSEPEFQSLMGEITGAWSTGDFERALNRLEKILEHGSDEMKAQALFFRGMIRETSSELPPAREDWLEALALARQGSFLRFNLETHLGNADERSQSFPEALTWYRTALKTCADGEEFSGNQALSAMLRVMKGSFATEDSEIVARVLKKSWRVLEVPGEPNLRDLEAATIQLDQHFYHLADEIIKESAADE